MCACATTNQERFVCSNEDLFSSFVHACCNGGGSCADGAAVCALGYNLSSGRCMPCGRIRQGVCEDEEGTPFCRVDLARRVTPSGAGTCVRCDLRNSLDCAGAHLRRLALSL